MKHLPNLLTLANLFCGCIAIAYTLTAEPYIYYSFENGMKHANWVPANEQLFMGSVFILLAALCDMLDGLAARLLNVFSPIGKDLDSLADIVSFGVAPSVILFKMLWDANMSGTDAMEVSMLAMVPAFLVACFAALRLAKFNVTATKQKNYFIGMPTPAVGIFVASFPLLRWYDAFYISQYFQNTWVIYTLIAVLCFLMVSPLKFLKLMPSGKGIKNSWAQLTLAVISVASYLFLGILVMPIAFVCYIILSLVSKYPEEHTATTQMTPVHN